MIRADAVDATIAHDRERSGKVQCPYQRICLSRGSRKRANCGGAIEFTVNLHHRTVSVRKIIVLEFPGDEVIEFLLREAEQARTEKLGGAARVVEINVSAEAARTQQTLGELGFVPVAYVPALALVGTERLDVVKMFRLAGPVQIGTEGLTPQSEALAEWVLAGFERTKTMSSGRQTSHQTLR